MRAGRWFSSCADENWPLMLFLATAQRLVIAICVRVHACEMFVIITWCLRSVQTATACTVSMEAGGRYTGSDRIFVCSEIVLADVTHHYYYTSLITHVWCVVFYSANIILLYQINIQCPCREVHHLTHYRRYQRRDPWNSGHPLGPLVACKFTLASNITTIIVHVPVEFRSWRRVRHCSLRVTYRPIKPTRNASTRHKMSLPREETVNTLV